MGIGDRFCIAEQIADVDLLGGTGEIALTADHEGDATEHIIHGRGKGVAGRAVGLENDNITDIMRLSRHLTLDHIGKDDGGFGHRNSKDIRNVFITDTAQLIGGMATAFSAAFLSLGRAGTDEGFVLFEQGDSQLLVSVAAFTLVKRMIVLEGKLVEDLFAFGCEGALAFILILNPQYEGLTPLLGDEGIHEGDAQGIDGQVSAG